MKKQYNTPTLINHGSVQSITQLGGGSKRNDFLFFSAAAAAAVGVNPNTPVLTATGSTDAIIKLCNEPGANCPK